MSAESVVWLFLDASISNAHCLASASAPPKSDVHQMIRKIDDEKHWKWWNRLISFLLVDCMAVSVRLLVRSDDSSPTTKINTAL